MTRRAWCVLGLLLGLCSSSFADRIFIEIPSPLSTDDVNAETLRQLVRSAILELGHGDAATKEQSNYTLRPNVIRLGTSYVFSVEKWTKEGMANATQLKAKELEELDSISVRVVRACLAHNAAKNDIRMDEVTIDETTRGQRRRLNRSGPYLAAGPALLGGLGSGGPAYYLSLGRGWAIGPFILGFRFDFSIDPEASEGTALWTDFGLNLAYYFLDKEISPFIIGEFGAGLARHSDTRSASGGMLLGGTVGIALFRTYQVHLQLGLRGAALVDTAHGQTPVMGAFRIGASF